MLSSIDQAHCDLIYGLAVSLKPVNILEIGYGEGASARALWDAMCFNGNLCRYTIVDNWLGHQGKPPIEVQEHEIYSMSEEEFYRDRADSDYSYDLILSDADHGQADRWFDLSLRMLRSPGLLIYHDVTNANHPNLRRLITMAITAGLPSLIFDKSTRPDEHCERGLLIISKV